MSQSSKSDGRGLFGRITSVAADRVLNVVDPNVVIDHVDVDALLEKVDVNALLERVDVNRLLDRVDVDALMERVDVDALMDRVDVSAIVERAGIPDIVADSTSHLTGSALDLFRRPLVGLDEIIFRAVNRVFRRSIEDMPSGPADLIDWVEDHTDAGPVKTGRYAGPVTRLLAFFVDFVIVTAGFTALVAGSVFTVNLFAPDYELPANRGTLYVVLLVLWAFTYLWVSYAVFGKTIGKMMIGLRVVSSSGAATLEGRQPLIRVLSYPLSFAAVGIGLIGVVLNRQRQTWHDRLAKTAVVYDWGSRTAAMPTPLADYLERKGAEI